jgi:hypothetical protein
MDGVSSSTTSDSVRPDGVDYFGKDRLSHKRNNGQGYEAGYTTAAAGKKGHTTVDVGEASSAADERRPSPIAAACHKVLQNYVVQGFMIFLTVVILFVSDLFQATTDASMDLMIEIILWFCFATFSLEWILNAISSSLQTPPYFRSLFCYLDLVATLSIGIDIILLKANNLSSQGIIEPPAKVY